MDLDLEYTPSRWSKRFTDRDELLEDHIKTITEITENNLKKYKCDLNVPYGAREKERMDIYYKNENTDAPIFVFIHGGYWQIGSKDISGFCVGPIVEKGYRVIILDYDNCPAITLEELVEQIKKATKFIFNYAQETFTESLTFCGHSAGGHLLAELLDKDILDISNLSIFKGAFFISGVYDLTELWKIPSVNENDNLSLNEINAKKLSPIYEDYKHLKQLNIKYFIYVANDESNVFKNQSEELHELFKNNNLNTKFKIIENVDHFDIAENLQNEDYEITEAILKVMSE